MEEKSKIRKIHSIPKDMEIYQVGQLAIKRKVVIIRKATILLENGIKVMVEKGLIFCLGPNWEGESVLDIVTGRIQPGNIAVPKIDHKFRIVSPERYSDKTMLIKQS